MEGKKDISKAATDKYLDDHFDSWFVKGISDFVRVPNLTPMVDPEYLKNGLWEKALEVIDNYINQLKIEGLTRHVIQPEGSQALILYIVDPKEEGPHKTVMMYGHLDKQPWFTGWDEGLSPIDPVIRGDLLYGRGSSDDGYAPFASMMAVKMCQE